MGRDGPIRARLRIGLNIVGVSQMTTFCRLQGLPTYGPMAIGFPEEWAPLGQEGLLVEFPETDGTMWVGNFRPGLDGLDTVRWHSNGTHVLVTSAGALWCVDPDSRASENIAPAVFNLWELESGDLLFDNQGLEFIRLGRSGVVWYTQRISWVGFQNVRLEAEQITGVA